MSGAVVGQVVILNDLSLPLKCSPWPG